MKASILKLIKTQLESMYERCKPVIEKTGGHPPVLFQMYENGKVETIDFSPYIEDKDLMEVMLKAYQDEDGLDGTILLTEAWALRIDVDSEEGKRLNAGENPRIQPSDSPDKEEILFFMVETTGGDLAAEAPIIRKGEHTTLGPLKIVSGDDGELRGRFVSGKFNP